jgi:hypothetical protein
MRKLSNGEEISTEDVECTTGDHGRRYRKMYGMNKITPIWKIICETINIPSIFLEIKRGYKNFRKSFTNNILSNTNTTTVKP